MRFRSSATVVFAPALALTLIAIALIAFTALRLTILPAAVGRPEAAQRLLLARMACVAGFEGFQLVVGKREILVGKSHVIRRSTIVLDVDGELDGRWRRSRERGDSESCKNSKENGLELYVGRGILLARCGLVWA